MKTMIIDGVEYELNPVQKVQVKEKEDILSGYEISEPIKAKRAQPKVSEYREKFKRRELSLSDIKKGKPNRNPLPKIRDTRISGGDWFGEGLEYDI